MSGEQLLHRPIYGGVFGEDGRYAIASMPCVTRGLYATRYMVVQPQAGVVLSIADDKVQALVIARDRLQAANDKQLALVTYSCQAELALWPDPPVLIIQPVAATYVPKRRREVFEGSHGRCHYCQAVLRLEGRWHVEHQLPKALGGGTDLLNLVAACVRCNLAKSDSTAIEYVSRLSAAGRPRP